MSTPIFEILFALAKQDFEVRLIAGGALVIADLRYERGRPLREPLPAHVKLVFANAERIGRWLETPTLVEAAKAR